MLSIACMGLAICLGNFWMNVLSGHWISALGSLTAIVVVIVMAVAISVLEDQRLDCAAGDGAAQSD